MGVDVVPISHPISRKPSRAKLVMFQRCSWRQGSCSMMSIALSAAAVEAGVMEAVNM